MKKITNMKMWKSERKEHPSFTNKQITTIVNDHLKKKSKR